MKITLNSKLFTILHSTPIKVTVGVRFNGISCLLTKVTTTQSSFVLFVECFSSPNSQPRNHHHPNFIVAQCPSPSPQQSLFSQVCGPSTPQVHAHIDGNCQNNRRDNRGNAQSVLLSQTQQSIDLSNFGFSKMLALAFDPHKSTELREYM